MMNCPENAKPKVHKDETKVEALRSDATGENSAAVDRVFSTPWLASQTIGIKHVAIVVAQLIQMGEL